MTYDDEFACPVCGTDDYVTAYGPEQSPILIVGEFPGDVEIRRGVPMVGPMGGVLKSELRYLHMELGSVRRTNLWLHEPNKNDECYQYGMQQVIKEAKGRKAILLLGSDVVDTFVGGKVSKLTGLKVTSQYFSAPIIMACVNPAIVFKRGGVGEVRMALKKFVKACKKEGLI